jgi:hypothetical protein
MIKTTIVAAILSLGGLSAANAITCNGRFQDVTGHVPQTTPYCGDKLIAAVANGHGMQVSFREVHNNPATKYRACQHVGHDSLLTGLCPSGGNGVLQKEDDE